MYELTCDSHASVIFAFVYGFHDLLGGADKALGTPLGTHEYHKEILCSVATQQHCFTERQLLAEWTVTVSTYVLL